MRGGHWGALERFIDRRSRGGFHFDEFWLKWDDVIQRCMNLQPWMEGIEFNGEVDYCWGLGAWAVPLIYDLHIDWFALSQINRFLLGCSLKASPGDKTWFVRDGGKCQDSYGQSVVLFHHSRTQQEVWRTFSWRIPWEGAHVRYLSLHCSTESDGFQDFQGANLHQPTRQRDSGALLLGCYDSVNKMRQYVYIHVIHSIQEVSWPFYYKTHSCKFFLLLSQHPPPPPTHTSMNHFTIRPGEEINTCLRVFFLPKKDSWLLFLGPNSLSITRGKKRRKNNNTRQSFPPQKWEEKLHSFFLCYWIFSCL